MAIEEGDAYGNDVVGSPLGGHPGAPPGSIWADMEVPLEPRGGRSHQVNNPTKVGQLNEEIVMIHADPFYMLEQRHV